MGGALKGARPLFGVATAGLMFLACDGDGTDPGGGAGQGGDAGQSGEAGQAGDAGSSGLNGASGSAGQGASAGSAGSAGVAGSAGQGGGSGTGGTAGSAGMGGTPPIVYACPASETPTTMVSGCGDGHIDPMTEECDDGDAASVTDFCDTSCQLRDRPLVWNAMMPSASPQRIGDGPHVLSAGCHGFAAATVDIISDPATITLRRFDHHGADIGTPIVLASGPRVVEFAHPSIAALPDGGYAVVWTEYGGDGDGLGIKLQHIAPDGTTWSTPQTVNTTTTFGQYDADVHWSNEKLIVVWTDDSNVETAPDLRYRQYATVSLLGAGSEKTLAETKAAETRATIAPMGTGYAFAYLYQDTPTSEVVVQDDAGNTVRTGDLMGRLARSAPRLVERGIGKLALAYASSLTWSGDSPLGISILGLDTASPMAADFSLEWDAPPEAEAGEIENFALAIANNELFVASAWFASLSGTTGSNVYLQSQPLDMSALPTGMSNILPLHRLGHRPGDEEHVALASQPLYPTDALIAMWEDSGVLPADKKAIVQPMVSVIPTPVHRLVTGQ